MKSRTGLEEAKPTKQPKGPTVSEGDQEKEPQKDYPPSVKRRWNRSLTVTFTSGDIPHRLRELALEWDLYAPDGKSPATSTVVEYLLSPQLEAAEEGEIAPPPRGWRASRRP
jgi:hypothetical protein